MIQTIVTPNGGTMLYRTQSATRRRNRRRWQGLLVVGLIACSGAVVSAFNSQASFDARTTQASAEMLPPGPFSFFPQ